MLRIEEVDPADEAGFAEWFSVLDACLEAERPGEPHWTIQEQRPPALELVTRGSPFDGGLLVARSAGSVVRAARLRLPLRERLHAAEVLVLVHPEHRLRGIGRALLRELVARASGRDVVTTEIDEPPGRPSDGARFAEAVGARLVLVTTRRALSLPPDADRLAALPVPTGAYEILSWQNRVPGVLLVGRVFLEEQIDQDAPSGGIGPRFGAGADLERRQQHAHGHRQRGAGLRARREAVDLGLGPCVRTYARRGEPGRG